MAEAFSVTILEKLAESLVAPIGRQFKYLFCYNNIIDNLKDEVNELQLMRDGDQMRVEEARNNVQTINPLVGDWLSKVDDISTRSEMILEDTVNAQKGCLNGWCPNLKSRHLLARRATKKTKEVVELKGKGKFDWVSVVPTPTLTYSSIGFESRKSTVKEIIDALKDPEINVIGVSGMGGVGKTTMVEEVCTQARAEGLFDEVAMAVVSQNHDLLKIQGELGDELSLRFDEQASIRARANKLLTRLKNGKRILIILDDLWEGLDLGVVGLPVGGDYKECKVLLASRNERVCKETGTQKSFVVQVLSNEEAWDLFKAKAGSCVDEYDLDSIAKEVAEECSGLPIAIVTLAVGLKDRTKHVWIEALQHLRNSTATNIPGMGKKVESSIELSYIFLESKAKSLFLLCCLFPKDQVISVTSLVACGMGLRIFDDVETLVAKRDRVCSLVDELINCHLLVLYLANGDDTCVKLRYVVRDVGLSIASKEGKVYLEGFDTKLEEWSQNDMQKCYTAICLISNEILQLPVGVDFTMLELLVVRCTHYPPPLLSVSLGNMEHLRVITVTGMHIESLAQLLRFSPNLRTLRLENCELPTDISFIGSMEYLEILSFKDSKLDALPSSIGKLGNLKLLDLRFKQNQHTIIPFDVLSGLKKLEELYMGKYFFHAHVEDDKEGNRGSISAELIVTPGYFTDYIL